MYELSGCGFGFRCSHLKLLSVFLIFSLSLISARKKSFICLIILSRSSKGLFNWVGINLFCRIYIGSLVLIFFSKKSLKITLLFVSKPNVKISTHYQNIGLYSEDICYILFLLEFVQHQSYAVHSYFILLVLLSLNKNPRIIRILYEFLHLLLMLLLLILIVSKHC